MDDKYNSIYNSILIKIAGHPLKKGYILWWEYNNISWPTLKKKLYPVIKITIIVEHPLKKEYTLW